MKYALKKFWFNFLGYTVFPLNDEGREDIKRYIEVHHLTSYSMRIRDDYIAIKE